MSRIGVQPVKIEDGVTVSFDEKAGVVTVSGSNGELKMDVPKKVRIEIKDGEAIVSRSAEDKSTRAMHGFIRASIFLNSTKTGHQVLG